MTKQSAYLTIRPAIETDQVAIRTLVHSEQLNPYGLDWPNFMVAVIGPVLVGAVQLRRHLDGSRELGSLVVRKEARRRGIASRLIDALLAGTNERVLLITVEALAARYERWGFRQSNPKRHRQRSGAITGSEASQALPHYSNSGASADSSFSFVTKSRPCIRQSRQSSRPCATRSKRVPKRLAFDRAPRQARV